jgi:hypothetical protein
VDEFDYFMIRIRRPGSGGSEPAVAGTVERIGTGRKMVFASGAELLRFLLPVHSLDHNMPSDVPTGKQE